MTPFDILRSPLKGTNLIEASAGTGKTYTITALFLRLLLEMRLTVQEILVVTFTEAATEELRERIRGTLREAIEAFSSGRGENGLVDGLIRQNQDPAGALSALGDALRDFDEAAIHTIHGFCRRMLYENAFESGSLFDTELVTDEEILKRDAIDDFWRRHLLSASPLFVNYAIQNNLTPDTLYDLLANRIAQPYLQITPQVEKADTSAEEKLFMDSFGQVQEAWPSVRDEIEDILTKHQGLNRTQYGRGKIPGWVKGMNDFLASDGRNPFLFGGFDKFTSGELAGSVKKGWAPPGHPFFDLCEKLKQRQGKLEAVFARRLLGLKGAFFHELRETLARTKRERNILTFDDLLLRLQEALFGPGAERLTKAMRMTFKAALIDEFQDTDPVQYAILRHVFDYEKGILFFIGDPKQAIYGFRGADIFAYMEARRDVETRYSLGENWRSEPQLIDAVNALFSNRAHPFVYDEIPFQPTKTAKDKDAEKLNIKGRFEPPFKIWFLDARNWVEPGRPITKGLAREVIPKAVAGEISKLLNLGEEERAFIGQRPLRAEDVAVLVRRNADAKLIQKALSALGIPSVLFSTGNLFDSREAMETERVLGAIVAPNNERLLRSALATDMMGMTGEGLEALVNDEAGLEERLMMFRRYHELWQDRGFIRMFRTFLAEEKVLARLIRLTEGERRNTNVLHLMEVLHRACVERKLSMTGLIKWLSEQRGPERPQPEEYQLRLESDERAVKLVTIHKSKGLEYPVVFCPFSWDGSRLKNSKEPFTFHREGDGMMLSLDLGSEEINENRLLAEKEQLAENVRLLYVALTRARCRVYLVWGRFNEAETSAPAYLLHPSVSAQGEDIVGATGEIFRNLSDEGVLAGVEKVVKAAKGSLDLHEMPMELGVPYVAPAGDTASLSCRHFSGNIGHEWKISSFSSLIARQRHGEELADRDGVVSPNGEKQEVLEDGETEEALSGIFAFPKGTNAGTFLHDLLEHMDFAAEDKESLSLLVQEKLRRYGFESIWVETIMDVVRKVLSVPLEPGRNDFFLSRIPNCDRLNELEFYFPLRLVTPADLEKTWAKSGRPEGLVGAPEQIGRLSFAPVRGYMKGFMDLVFRFEGRFYLVDWKSNFLGSRVQDYDEQGMAAAMAGSFYTLQYHLYTLALHQYLKVKQHGYDYERHFGGVYYIFLRGVDPEEGSQCGVYRDKPSKELIDELGSLLLDVKKKIRD